MLTDGDPVPALKRQLAGEIQRLLGAYNSSVGARVLGIDQPRMSDLIHGKLDRFSLQKLVRLLAHIDRRVKLEVVNEGPATLRIWNFPPRGKQTNTASYLKRRHV